MSFVLSNLHMSNFANDTVSTIKQLADDKLLGMFKNKWLKWDIKKIEKHEKFK